MCIRDRAVLPAVARHRLHLVSGNHADAEDIRALIRSVGLA